MYTTTSKNLCTLNVIKSHLLNWIKQGYTFTHNETSVKLEATQAVVAKLLAMVEHDGYVCLISSDDLRIISVYYNSSERMVSLEPLMGHLKFVYEVRLKVLTPPNPVREVAMGARAYLVTS